jgi:hypothetical protein
MLQCYLHEVKICRKSSCYLQTSTVHNSALQKKLHSGNPQPMKILAFIIGTYHEKEREEFCPAAQCSKGQCSARFFGIDFFLCHST